MDSTRPPETSPDLPCHRCGYDLRAHPLDGKCPECEASVAESKRAAAIPLCPAWRDSDPRWRRHLIAGAWLLVFLPLMDVLEISGWVTRVPVPTVFNSQGALHTLNETYLYNRGVYRSLIFCMGAVLLFSKERGRRRARFDWTRRWGVLCTYVTLLLSAVPILLPSALVLVGISSVFQSMPLKYQPKVTPFFLNVSATYLRYGPYPKDISYVVRVAFSSITILLACFPLFEALRRTVPKPLAATLLAPLALFSLVDLAIAARYCFGSSGMTLTDIDRHGLYFRPELLVRNIASLPSGLDVWESLSDGFFMEAAKWGIFLAIALWLTLVRFAPWFQDRKTTNAENTWRSACSE